MPRAVDPSLMGQQLPLDHSPLNRINYQLPTPADIDLGDILESVKTFVTDFLFPAIEDLTGIDLSIFLPLLDVLDLDFSTPEAFLTSFFGAIVALPGAILQVVTGVIESLTSPDGSEQLTDLLGGLLALLITLPDLLIQLATSLISSGAGLLGIDSSLDANKLFNFIPKDLIAQLNPSHIGESITNLIADPFFLDGDSFNGLAQWFHLPGGGFGGNGAASTTADGSTKELLGNLIPASPGQVMPISGKAKWTGLVGTGNPIALAVTGYDSVNSAIDQTTIASHNTTPTTTDWVDLSGSYTVPANVASVRTRLVVGSTATAGTVDFSNMSASKNQSLLQKLIAGQNPGENLTDDISNLFTGIVTNALGLNNKAGLSDFNDLVSTIEGDVQSGFESIGSVLQGFLTGSSILDAGQIGTGNVADEHVPGLSSIHDVIVNAVGALTGGGFDLGKMFEVLTGQTNSVVSTSAGLAGTQSRLAHAESKLASLPVSLGGTGVGISFGGIVGGSDLDEFERVSTTSLGTLWAQYYSSGGGTWATPNGHDAEYMFSGTSDREFVCVRNNSALLRSLTDYQQVTQVLSSKATRHYDSIAGTFNYVGHNDIWLRVSDTTTSLANITGIRIRFGGDGSLSIVRFLNGAGVTLKAFGTGAIASPGPGAALIGEAGDMNGGSIGQRYFRGIIGNSIVIEVTETGTASGFGAAFRKWGHGGRVEGWSGLFDNGQERPGTLHHWSAMDQVFS